MKNAPDIRRDFNKPEWNAVVTFDTEEEKNKVLKEMRFFRWPQDESQPVIEIRALPYGLVEKNLPEINEKTLFCKNLRAEMVHS